MIKTLSEVARSAMIYWGVHGENLELTKRLQKVDDDDDDNDEARRVQRSYFLL